jgi:dihydropteroate synthase
MNLIEPLALLDGAEAAEAVAAGRALPLRGGGAFALARLIGPGGGRLVAAGDLPAAWLGQAAVLAAEPDWGVPVPSVMGILNVTPDSFSDGRVHLDPVAAVAAGRRMLADGAAILDVGGESTRPGAAPVTVAEECRRVVPVIAALRDAVVSVDTRNAAVMQAALEAGARIVNDVSALRHDPESATIIAESGCQVILMHMRGTPETMTSQAQYDDLAVDVVRELAGRVAAAEAAGIAWERIAVDPGFGFAKEGMQNAELLRRLPLLLNLGRPLVVGVSRKRFIGTLSGGVAPLARGPGSLAAALFALFKASCVIRVHDVAETAAALRVWTGLRGVQAP